jgi:hypothetical protein
LDLPVLERLQELFEFSGGKKFFAFFAKVNLGLFFGLGVGFGLTAGL